MKRLRLALAAALAPLLLLPVSTAAQAKPVGTILLAHGGGPEWNAQVEAIAALARTGGPVEVSFLMGQGAPAHRFQDAARRLVEMGAGEIVVVPLLVSSHGSHFRQVRWLAGEEVELGETMMHHLHMAGIERADVAVPIRLARPIEGSPEVADVLADRALALADDPAAQALFLVGHGPNDAVDHAEWMRNLRPVMERVRQLTPFRDVKLGLVRDDAPPAVRAEAVQSIRETIELQHALTGRPVVVVPILVSTGTVSREKLPKDLEGLPVVYTGDALLPHPGMARWVEARVRERQ